MLFTKLLRETDGPLVTRITSRLSRFFQRDGGSCENVTRSVEILSIETSSHSIDSGWTSSRSPTISNTENSRSTIHNPVHNPPKLKSHTLSSWQWSTFTSFPAFPSPTQNGQKRLSVSTSCTVIQESLYFPLIHDNSLFDATLKRNIHESFPCNLHPPNFLNNFTGFP